MIFSLRPLRIAFWIRLLFLVPLPLAAEGIALLVPAYFSPRAGGDWDRLVAAAPRVPLVAIANPFNGPGPDPTANPDYTRAISAVRKAGGQVIGYVYTQYARRPLAEVKADLQKFHDLYPLNGFFLDEVTNDTTTTHLNYYAELLAFIRSLDPDHHVTLNPGTSTVEAYLSRPTGDTVVTFENSEGYANLRPAPWTRNYPAHRFGHLLHTVSDLAFMTNAVTLAQQRNTGFLYITDDVMNNPWDRLPTYWDALVNTVEAENRAAAAARPPRLQLQPGSDPGARLELDAPPGRFVIESSSSLNAWTPVTTNLTPTGRLVWEPILLLGAARFFRARVE